VGKLKKFLGKFNTRKIYEIDNGQFVVISPSGKQIDKFQNKQIFDYWKLHSGFQEKGRQK
jgi:hypothetical protein